MERFAGTVARLGAVEPSAIVDWITAIPFEEWPQQTRLEDGGLRPAMVKDPAWHGFDEFARPLVDAVVAEHFNGRAASNVMLTVVMPGHSIPPHVDEQPPNWQCRVHVPLTTNPVSRFVVGAEHHHMEVGMAYQVNTEVEHSVANDGDTPRVHLMWDVLDVPS